MLEMFGIGFSEVFQPFTLLLLLIGVIIGVVFGSIPGLTGTMGLALILPLTFGLSATTSLALLVSVYLGACSGGMISSILLKMPGTISSVITVVDGYPMAQKGEAGKALGTGIVYSFLGGMLSFLALFFIAPPIADIAVKFGPFEYFSIAFFAITLISSIAGDSMVKGLLAGLLGMAIAVVGISPIDGYPRYAEHFLELSAGFGILPVLIGLFAISEIISQAGSPTQEVKKIKDYKIKGFGFSLREFIEQVPNFFRSGIIGIAIGILPGIGGSTSSVLAYLAAKKRSKYPEKFGTGIMDGVAAPETANNASVGGALIPLLALGIPGDTATAVLIGAFTIHGLSAGPLLFQNSSDLVYTIFASLIVANIAILSFQYFGMRLFVKALQVPKHILMPIIMVLSVVGALGVNNRIFDVWAMFLFGIVGFILNKVNFPIIPLMLGYILTPIAEINLRRGLELSDNSILPFFTSPISGVFLVCAFISIGFSVYKGIKKSNDVGEADQITESI